MRGPENLKAASENILAFLAQLSSALSDNGPTLIANHFPEAGLLLDQAFTLNFCDDDPVEFFQKHNNFSLVIWDSSINSYNSKIQPNYGLKNSNSELITAIDFVECLGGNGIMLIPAPAAGIRKNTFLEHINRKGYDIRGYIDLPNSVMPQVAINCLWVVVGKGAFENKFLYSIKNLSNIFHARNSANLFARYLSGDPEVHLNSCKKDEFSGFANFYLRREISSLLSNDRNFRRRKLSDLIDGIRTFDHAENDLPHNVMILNTVATVSAKDVAFSSIDSLNKKHRYHRLEFNSEIDRDYAVSFFNTDLGKKILLSAATGSTIPNVSIGAVQSLEIPCPPKDVQVRISDTTHSIKLLYEQMNDLYQELVYNPKNVDSIQADVAKLLDSIGQLGIVDKIKSEIRGGEGKSLEFKQTLALCIREHQRKDYVEQAVLKTLCGFMNTEGGVLLVGVDDDGLITGVNNEMKSLYKNSKDEYLKKVRNLIDANLGIENSSFVDWNIHDIDGFSILRFEVKASSKPVFLRKTDFFIRTNPATDKLDGEEMLNYIKQRFQ